MKPFNQLKISEIEDPKTHMRQNLWKKNVHKNKNIKAKTSQEFWFSQITTKTHFHSDVRLWSSL